MPYAMAHAEFCELGERKTGPTRVPIVHVEDFSVFEVSTGLPVLALSHRNDTEAYKDVAVAYTLHHEVNYKKGKT
jgi:hypothetical protein